MNFSVKKKIFLDSLNTAIRAVSSTTPLPVLGGIKLLVLNNELTLISSDSNISIKTVIKNNEKEILSVKEEGGIVIDARYILEIVRKIDSDFINFEVFDDTLAKIYGGNSEFKINGINVNEYPEINFDTTAKSFELETSKLFNVIDKTIFACSESDTRPILTGVNFKANSGKLYVNATDSFRLASMIMDIDNSLDFNITVPAKYLLDVYHSIDMSEKVSIAIDNQKIIFMINDSIIETRLLDDAFPDTSKLIPTNFSNILKVSAKEFLSAIDRTSFIKSDGKNIIKMHINEKEVILTSSNQMGSSYENINVISFEGKEFDISCSGKYLTDAIKAIDSNEVEISFSGELKPFIVTKPEDKTNIQLISPVRTYK